MPFTLTTRRKWRLEIGLLRITSTTTEIFIVNNKEFAICRVNDGEHTFSSLEPPLMVKRQRLKRRETLLDQVLKCRERRPRGGLRRQRRGASN